jgi:hypothetical protein
VTKMTLAVLATAAVLVLTGPASAQEYPDAAVITVSDSSLACPSEDFTITGSGFLPGETVDIFFDSEQVATVEADSDGTFTVTIAAPDAPAGEHTVAAVGESGSDDTATVTCVTGAAVAFTGANISMGLILLAALVAVGAVALYAGRRRARSTA